MKLLRPVLIAILVSSAPQVATGLTFVVTSTADSGAGSLREAIAGVNAAPGPHEVVFDIPELECSALGICRITLLTPLDPIAEPVTIDGTTQPRWGSAPANVCATGAAPSSLRVEIENAAGITEFVFALDPAGAAGASTFRGLAFYGGDSISITTAGAHRVQCNHFGADATGASAPIPSGGNRVVLHMAAQGAIVGTDGDGQGDLAERNVFVRGGTFVYVNANSDNRISGNFFGLSADGLTPQPGCGRAVLVRQSSARNLVGSDGDGVSDALERNVFGGCAIGVDVATFAVSGEDNEVVGNWFGMTADGSPAGGMVGVRFTPSVVPGGGVQLLSQNRIENNTEGIVVTHAMAIDPASSGNCIGNNLDGFVHEGSADLVFEDNWWGAADGPSGAGPGSGDSVVLAGTGTLDFAPWSGEAACPLPEPGAGAWVAGCAWLAALRRSASRARGRRVAGTGR